MPVSTRITGWLMGLAMLAAPLLCCCLGAEPAAAETTQAAPHCHAADYEAPAEHPEPADPADSACGCHESRWEAPPPAAVAWTAAALQPLPDVLTHTPWRLVPPRVPTPGEGTAPRGPPPPGGRERCVLHAVFLI